MLDIDNQTELVFNAEMLEKIAAALTTQPVELIITDNIHIQELNHSYRDKNAPTDVLSFPMEAPFTEATVFGLPLGSIVISAEYAEEKAKNYGHTVQDELTLLFIHGLLHLLGYDHETDHGEMRAKERELIEQWGLPASLIVRTEES
ncbi:MAG: rRNA maturation RNase YbeY [Sulfurovum sp.]|nr:MAG: rRNA maturation RNase YbeY [Sulfurovum sp.]